MNVCATQESGLSTEGEGGEPSHPPLRLTKLQDSFMDAGSKLHSTNPELFAYAVQQLFTQFSLAVAKNPEVLCCSTPSEASCKRSCSVRPSEKKEDVQQPSEHQKRCYRKYTLPGDGDEREYYQCMTCQERRHENSFSSNHIHMGQRAKIRWYCPLCDAFFAVTHRSGHIKNRHSKATATATTTTTTTAAVPSAQTPSFYAGSSDEAIERRVAMIATAAAAAVVSASTQQSSSYSKEEEEEEEEEEKKEEEEIYYSSPPEKRARICTDDYQEPEPFVEATSASPSSFSPSNQFSEDAGDDDLYPFGDPTSSLLFSQLGGQTTYIPPYL